LTAAAGGSPTIRFERFTFQASTSGGGIDSNSQVCMFPVAQGVSLLRKSRSFQGHKAMTLSEEAGMPERTLFLL
jgi:hypothetical protein